MAGWIETTALFTKVTGMSAALSMNRRTYVGPSPTVSRNMVYGGVSFLQERKKHRAIAETTVGH